MDLKRLLAWQTLPRAVYSILNSSDISHDKLNSLSGSGVMDSMAFLMPGMKNRTCSGTCVSMHRNVGITTEPICEVQGTAYSQLCRCSVTLCFAAAAPWSAVGYFRQCPCAVNDHCSQQSLQCMTKAMCRRAQITLSGTPKPTLPPRLAKRITNTWIVVCSVCIKLSMACLPAPRS